jgi:hypothetical protein
MQLRNDIAMAYLGILGTSVAALVFPVPVFLHMVIIAALTIYIGSHNAVIQSKSSDPNAEVRHISHCMVCSYYSF